MNRLTIILLSIICLNITAFSQNQAANWTFGENAGLNFNSGSPVFFNQSELVTTEGCSSISDKYGNLLLYSDGITVWNRNHQVMQNGTDLMGDDSSTQSAIIIPRPSSENIFYIFTVDDRAGANGLRFSEVDLSLAGGLGAVTNNKNILLENSITEKLTAIEAANGEDIWVISHRWESNEFVSFLVTDLGVTTTPVVSGIGSIHQGDINQTIGYLKVSPNREKIASVTSYKSEIGIFDFNASTGQLSNPIAITKLNLNNPGYYGCEFSPNSQLLYITELNYSTNISNIHQFNLSLNSQTEIINSDIIVGTKNGRLGALQQAIDGKVYVAEFNEPTIGVINSPNTIGTDCNFISGAVFLGESSSQLGLPPFIQSYFFATNLFSNTCFGDATEFSIESNIPLDSIEWNFGDPDSGINNTSNLLNPTHIFSSYGNFDITVNYSAGGENQTLYRTINISEKPPELNLGPLFSCENINTYNLENALPQSILGAGYNISYYTNIEDAELSQNSIPNYINYNATNENQTIYIKLVNGSYSDCYSISELLLSSISEPTIDSFEEVFFCQNNDTDSVLIDAGNLENPINQYAFLWQTSQQTTYSLEVYEPGDYTVRITPNSSITTENPDGCYVERIVSVTSSSIASINYIEQIGTATFLIYVDGLGDYEYSLNEDGPYQDNNIFYNVPSGQQTFYIRDKKDCGIVSQEFSVIGFPQFFTPNNDTINDYWQVYGVSSQFQPNSKIFIFDRYGKLLSQIDPKSKGWDGTYNGQPMPTNDYWFSVTLQDGRVFKSHFTLKR